MSGVFKWAIFRRDLGILDVSWQVRVSRYGYAKEGAADHRGQRKAVRLVRL